MVSPASRAAHQGYGPGVHYLSFPWSNERQRAADPRASSCTPRLGSVLRGIDVFNTLDRAAGAARARPSSRTSRPCTPSRRRRRSGRWCAPTASTSYPHTAKVADAIIINSESLRAEVLTYLDVDPAKLRLVPEAVDHATFRPGDPDEARGPVERYGVDRPFVLFVSSLVALQELRRAAAGLRRWRGRTSTATSWRSSAPVATPSTSRACTPWPTSSASPTTWSGSAASRWRRRCTSTAPPTPSPTRPSTRPSGCPSWRRWPAAARWSRPTAARWPETAGGAALLADPDDPESIADALVRACGPEGAALRPRGLARAAEFSWARTGELTLEVYREVAPRPRRRCAREDPGHRRSRVHRLPHLRPARASSVTTSSCSTP